MNSSYPDTTFWTDRATRLLWTACALAALTACGKKTESQASAMAPPPMAANEPSMHSLEPVFQVPAKYASYVRQEVTEATKAEYQTLPDAAFEGYVARWIQQASSIAQPDWFLLASMAHPELAAETNAFKKQEAADRAKAEAKPDPNSLRVIFGWKGEVMDLSSPDVATGEYHLILKPSYRYDTVGYSTAKNYNYGLYYHPLFTAFAMGGSSVELTVKVPIATAKAIEALRETDHEKHPGMVRVYGHVTANKPNETYINKSSSQAALEVEVEALEVGTRQDGQFKPYFFLDTDQLKRWRM